MTFTLKTKEFIYRNLKLRKRLEKMLDNQRYADTVFLVNKAKFHASSHLISIHSDVLHDLIDEHFENCGDREIRIAPVKHEISFLVLLQYMYGLDISFTALDKEILCEILYLCSLYQVIDFFEDLKTYIADIEIFDKEYVVALLNTAKKYEIKDLYEQLLVFTFRNANEIVKHHSFEELRYDVLVDLIQSDWFNAPEKDIFLGMVEWHNYNINLDELMEEYHTFPDDPEEVGCSVEDALAPDHEYNDAESCNTSTKCVMNGHSVIKHLNELSILPSTTNTTQPGTSTSQERSLIVDTTQPGTNTSQERSLIVENFSENMLKRLMKHIRLRQMTTNEYREILELYDIEPYQSVLKGDHFSQSKVPRYFCSDSSRFRVSLVENVKKCTKLGFQILGRVIIFYAKNLSNA